MTHVLSKLRAWTPFLRSERQAPGASHTLPERPAPHPSCAFREILVAIDYAAHPALQVGIALASATMGRLIVLHVSAADTNAIHGGNGAPASHEDPNHVLAAARAFVPTDIQADYFLVEGDPAEQICKFVSQIRPDLIVMGARRTETGEGPLKGAITRGTLLRCPCPLLLVPVNK